MLSGMNPEYEVIIISVLELLKVDFSALLQEQLDYADQTEIKKSRIWMMAACDVHYDLEFGLVLHFLSGEYIVAWCDLDGIMEAAAGHVSISNKAQILRILTIGCPANLAWEEKASNKENFIKRGNNPSIKANWKAVAKTLNKEDRNHHIMTFPCCCGFAPGENTTTESEGLGEWEEGEV